MRLPASPTTSSPRAEVETGPEPTDESYYYASIALVASVTGSMLRGRTLARNVLHLDGCIIRRLPRYSVAHLLQDPVRQKV